MMTKFNYNTEHNSELFGSLTPDGWLIDSTKKIIVVISKKSIKQKKLQQAN